MKIKDAILLKIIDELLESYNFNESSFKFAKESIHDIFLKLNEDTMYKNIVYINNNKIGRFAISYVKKFKTYINNKDFDSLNKLLTTCKTVEYDDNKYLTGKYLERKNKEFDEEMLSIIYLIDKQKYKDNVSINILKDYEKCEEEICMINENKSPIIPCKNKFIWVPSYSDVINSAYCFKLPELLILLLENNNNPYTNEKFCEKMKNNILSKYKYETLLLSPLFD